MESIEITGSFPPTTRVTGNAVVDVLTLLTEIRQLQLLMMQVDDRLSDVISEVLRATTTSSPLGEERGVQVVGSTDRDITRINTLDVMVDISDFPCTGI